MRGLMKAVTVTETSGNLLGISSEDLAEQYFIRRLHVSIAGESCWREHCKFLIDDFFFMIEIFKGGGSETEVTWEDQLNINKFGRLNSRFHELEDAIKIAKVLD